MTDQTPPPPPYPYVPPPGPTKGPSWWASRSTKAKRWIIAGGVALVFAIIGSASNQPKSTPTGSAQATPTATASAKASATMTASSTAKTPASTPAGDPHALTEANVRQGVFDNEKFAPFPDFSNLTIEVAGADVTLRVKPDEFNSASRNRHVASDALAAGKALLTGYYPAIQSVTVTELAEYTDPYGKKSTDPAVTLTIDKATSAKYDYDGLKNRVAASSADMFCVATSYYIHPANWKDLDSGDKGCMTASVKLGN